MNNPFSPYFAKLLKEKKITQNEEKIIQNMNALFAERIPSEIVNFLNSLAFVVESIHWEQTIQLLNRFENSSDKTSTQPNESTNEFI